MFDDCDFANGRLSGTIIKLSDGTPIIVEQVRGGRVEYRTLSDYEYSECPFSPNHIDLSPLPLGYVNGTNEAYYLCREPKRRWKQGLDAPGVKRILEDKAYNFPLFEFRPALIQAFQGKYATISKCIKLAKKGKAQAFSQRYALRGYGGDKAQLEYMGGVIGTFNYDTEEFELEHEHKYLLEDIMEAIHHAE